ncbi:MAG: hypothetical protein FWG98_02945 [Candidatus Cloacimonetes bacterium]|nr:hypothetical protein [Candidatus Cloacimonadota bacterium]
MIVSSTIFPISVNSTHGYVNPPSFIVTVAEISDFPSNEISDFPSNEISDFLSIELLVILEKICWLSFEHIVIKYPPQSE